MQHIQWYPGHMTKAMRMMEDNVKLVDGVIIILDARAPYACINQKLDKLFQNKPILYVLNKSDLVNNTDLQRVISDFKKNGKHAISVVATDKKTVNFLYKNIFLIFKTWGHSTWCI